MNKPKPPRRRPAFTPVAVRPRHDGWLPDKQCEFIDMLAETACIDAACAHVGMSRQSAYALRSRADASSFRRAWDAALEYGLRTVGGALVSRAVNGVEVPHYYRGELVGTHRKYDNRLAMWLLSRRMPERYGAWIDRQAFDEHPDADSLDLDACSHDLRLEAYKRFDEEAARARRKTLPSGDAASPLST